MISSSALVAPPSRAQGLPSLGRRASSFAVVCGTGKKIKTDKPFGACHAAFMCWSSCFGSVRLFYKSYSAMAFEDVYMHVSVFVFGSEMSRV